MSEMEQEIQQMLEALGPAAESAPKPGTEHRFLNDPVVEDNPAQGPVQIDPDVRLGPTEEELKAVNPDNLSGEPPKEPEKKEDPGAGQLQQLTVGLLQQMQQMASQMGEMRGTIAALQSQQPQQELDDSLKPAPLQNTALVTAEDIQGVVNEDGSVSVEGLMRALQKVGERSYQLSREHTYRDLPSIIEPVAQRQSQLHSTATLFWDKNKDLRPFQDRVSNEANSIYAQNPGLSIDQVYQKAADKVRGDLAAYAKAMGTTSNPQPANPKFPPAFVPSVGGGGTDRPTQPNKQPTSMQQEIQQLLKVAGAL